MLDPEEVRRIAGDLLSDEAELWLEGVALGAQFEEFIGLIDGYVAYKFGPWERRFEELDPGSSERLYRLVAHCIHLSAAALDALVADRYGNQGEQR